MEDLKYRTIIQTERLQLRPISLADADDIFHIRSFREIYQWTIAGQWTLKSQATEWVTTNLANPKSFNFVIELLPNPSPTPDSPPATVRPKVVGSLGSPRHGEIGYMFHPDYWGRGYATEALRGFLKTYFEKLPQEECMVAITDKENPASRKVLAKVGFKEVRVETFENPTLGPTEAVVYEYRPVERKGEAKEEAKDS